MQKNTMTIVSIILALALVAACVGLVVVKNGNSAALADRDAEIVSLSEAGTAKDAEIAALNEAAASKDAEIAALNEAAGEKDSEIADLNADIAVLSAQVAAMESSGGAAADANIPSSVPGAFSTTRSFLYALEQNDITYTYNGLDRDGDDAIVIHDTCAGHNVTIHVWFMDTLKTASIRIWDLITFNPSNKAAVTDACNELNCSYKYVTFTAGSDNTVTLSYDAIFRDNADVGDVVLEGLLRSMSILKNSFPTLERYGN